MTTAALARWFQLRRGVSELEAVRLAEEVVIRRRELDKWWDAAPAVRSQVAFDPFDPNEKHNRNPSFRRL